MISGKVATLINERTLVINKGSKNGVQKSMQFMVYDSTGKKIIDPDTKKELGSLRIKKLPVEIIEVYPTYSIAETFQYEDINEGGTNSLFSSIGYLSPPKYVKKYETFAIDEHTKQAIDEERSIVKVGDIVEQVNVTDKLPRENS